jgi:hypothetical protein
MNHEIGFGFNSIYVAQDRDYWRVLVYAVVNYLVYKILVIFWIAKLLLASQEWLVSVGLVSLLGKGIHDLILRVLHSYVYPKIQQ